MADGGARLRLSAAGRAAAIAVAYLAAWQALRVAATQFEVQPGVSVWFPPAALDLVLLLVRGLRWWPLTLLNVPIYEALRGSGVDFGWLDLLIYDAGMTAGYAGAAAWLLRGAKIDPGLGELRDVAWFVAAGACAGPLTAATLQITNLAAFGHLPWSEAPVSVLRFWSGDATGVGMLAPFLLVALRGWPGLWAHPPPGPAAGFRRPAREKWPTIAAECLALAAGLWLAYGAERATDLDYTFLLWLPLTWVALRHGFARTTLVVLVVNLAVALMTKAQLGAIASLALQFGLMTLTLSALMLGSVSSEVQRSAERLRHDALHDPLTGLPNRVLFGDRLEHAVHRAAREQDPSFAVLFLDLDRFKDVNDGLGHAAGDRLLREVGERLAAAARAADTVARLGGDEFAVLADRTLGVAGVLRLAERLLRAFDPPFELGGREVRVATSVGVALVDGSKPARDLLRDADAALQEAKAAGGGHAVLFDQAMHARALDRLELETDLRRAIERSGDGELALHLQPLVALADRSVVGAEALARWRHPRRGWIAPATFILLAEETGLIHPLGRWILRAACARAQAWRTSDKPLRLGVNVSTRELQRPGFAEDALGVLAETGLTRAALDLELTESVLLERTPQVAGTLAKLSAGGVGLSIDDFGTGYASLGYLKHLPVGSLKIDRAFVRDVPGDTGSEAIIEAILALGRRMQLSVIAEGVETEAQAAFLRERGCAYAQGFLFGRPVPAADLSLALPLQDLA